MPTGVPKVSKVDPLADIDRAIAELQERRAAELENEKHRDELRKFLAARPFLNRVEVLRIARAMPVDRWTKTKQGKPVKSRHAIGARPNSGAVGPTIKAAREAKGWSREQLADKLGVHNSSVGYWERGAGWPAPKHHKKLSDLLNIPVAKLAAPPRPGRPSIPGSTKAPRSAAHAKVGRAIAEARAAKDMTQETVAQKLGVSSAGVYGWEAGRWAPGAEVAGKLAKLLAVPVERLQLPKANGAAPH